MSNKKKNLKRQIKRPTRFNDHVVGNLSNNRDGVDNGKGCLILRTRCVTFKHTRSFN